MELRLQQQPRLHRILLTIATPGTKKPRGAREASPRGRIGARRVGQESAPVHQTGPVPDCSEPHDASCTKKTRRKGRGWRFIVSDASILALFLRLIYPGYYLSELSTLMAPDHQETAFGWYGGPPFVVTAALVL